MPKFKRPAQMLRCIICSGEYEDVDGFVGPTCGKPSCIRAARGQGKPFAARAVIGKVKRGRKGLLSQDEADDLGLPNT